MIGSLTQKIYANDSLIACLSSYRTQDVPNFLSFLSEKEVEVFQSFTHKARKESFLLGRYCAKKAIQRLTGISDLSSVSIIPGAFRQPNVLEVGIDVSISHSHGLGVALAHDARFPCGIDIEVADRFDLSVMQSMQCGREKQLVHHMDEKVALSLIWCAKESLSKAIKTGFLCSPSILEIESISQVEEGKYEVSYVHFPIFRTFFYFLGENGISITLPADQAISLE